MKLLGFIKISVFLPIDKFDKLSTFVK